METSNAFSNTQHPIIKLIFDQVIDILTYLLDTTKDRICVQRNDCFEEEGACIYSVGIFAPCEGKMDLIYRVFKKVAKERKAKISKICNSVTRTGVVMACCFVIKINEYSYKVYVREENPNDSCFESDTEDDAEN